MVLEAMRVDLMSSEHGESSDDKILGVKPMPWRSAILQNYIDEFDAKHARVQFKKGKHQQRKRLQDETPTERRFRKTCRRRSSELLNENNIGN